MAKVFSQSKGASAASLPNVTTQTGTYAILTTDNLVLLDATSAGFTATLPTAIGNTGRVFTLKKTTAPNTVTIATSLAQTLDGAATFVLRNSGEVLVVQSDGSNWQIVSKQFGFVPVGGVIAFLVSLTNTPTLPSELVACNGQTLSDSASVYNTIVIPNLNGASAGTKRFLRGSTSSGATATNETHTHGLTFATSASFTTPGSATAVSSLTSPTNTASSLPSYYEVQYVQRIK